MTVGIEGDGFVDSVIIGFDFLQRVVSVDIVQLGNEFLQCCGRHLGNLPDPIFIAQQMHDLAVEYLPSELTWLLQDHAAIFGVGVVAEVGALVDEALAVAR